MNGSNAKRLVHSGCGFRVSDLIRAMAPVDTVVAAALSSQQLNINGESEDLATVLENLLWYDDYGPSFRYLKSIVRAYMNRIEEIRHQQQSTAQESCEPEIEQSDAMAELWMKILSSKGKQPENTSGLQGTGKLRTTGEPEESDHCYLSFPSLVQEQASLQEQPPIAQLSSGKDSSADPGLFLRARIFPRHNDVGLRVWEAGILLTEYLLHQHELEQQQRKAPDQRETVTISLYNRRIVELGAGVGLTSLVLAGCCPVQHVYATDYTNETLANLIHNIEINEKWILEERRKQPLLPSQQKAQSTNDELSIDAVIDAGYLEWNSYSNYCDIVEDDDDVSNILNDQDFRKSVQFLSQADLLLAADVAYDAMDLNALVQVFCRFLGGKTSSTTKAAAKRTTTTTVSNPNEDQRQTKSKVPSKQVLLATTLRNRTTFQKLESALSNKMIEKKLVWPVEPMNGCRHRDGSYQVPCVFPIAMVQPRNDVKIYSLTSKGNM